MEILSTIWQIVWVLLLLAAATGSIVLFIALLHPLRFDLRLRGSVRGQRAEVWFVYLFRMFKVGIIATPHTQDVVISFLGWKKRLERMSRIKPATPGKSSPPPAAAEEMQSKASTEEPADNQPAKEQAQPEAVKAAEVQPTEETPPTLTPASAEAEDVPTEPAEAAPPATDAAETIEPVVSQEQPKIDVDTRPLKPLKEVEEEYRATRDAETTTVTPGKSPDRQDASIKQLLRKFKRDASRRFSQIKGYLRLFRRKWRALAPVFKRFWQRGKKGFGLPRIDLLLRYALHEPYLTGMSHATLAVASGMAGQWGINFLPVPHFGAPMLYSRAWITGVIRPWRLLFATGALFFEKQIYVELWQLFKWYRAKKQL